MKLNRHQKFALAMWLGSKLSTLWRDHSVVSTFNEFCKGNILEWRVIYLFGMAGKIWNVGDKIYITGNCEHEVGTKRYNEQQIIIGDWNKEIVKLLEMYK